MLRLMTLSIAGGLLSGCFSHEAIYPVEWGAPESVDGGGCPRLDGIYANAGQVREADAYDASVAEARSLAHILNGGNGVESLSLWNKLGPTSANPAQDPNVTVELKHVGERLQVIATHADGERRSLELELPPECHDGLFAFEADWDADTETIAPVAPEFSLNSLALGRADDGSLLLHARKTASLFFFFVPAFGYTETAWLRFPPAPAVAVAAAEDEP